MTESEAKEQRRQELSKRMFGAFSAIARTYAGRRERKQVQSREVKKCQEK